MRVNNDEEYMALFNAAKDEHTIIGEASVSYFYSDVAAANIKKFNPDTKILIILRNPVDLLPSQHSQLYYIGDENIKDFRVAWEIGDKRELYKAIPECCRYPKLLNYKKLGYLSRHLERFHNIWNPKRILYLLMDDLKQDVAGSVNKVFDFLEIDPAVPIDYTVQNVNKAPRSVWLSRFTRAKTSPRISRIVNYTKQFIGMENFAIKQGLRELNHKEISRVPLSNEMKNILQDIYRDDIQRLGDMIGRDLSTWLA